MNRKGRNLMYKQFIYKTIHKLLSIFLVTIMLANMALPVLADGPIQIFLPLLVKDANDNNETEDELNNSDTESLIAPNLACPLDPAVADFQVMESNAGYTPGQFEVSDTGATQYRVNIDVPPGTAGLIPTIGLTYDSRGGNGLLGVGWSLTGLPKISRCSTTLAQHGFIDGVDFDDNDQFCLDGQHLVAVQTKEGAGETVYRTEQDTFAKVISYGVAGSGPASFQVQTKAGLTLEYGMTEDSRMEASGKPDVLAWAVNKISDTNGNYLTVSYTEDNANGEHYPTRIDYTGNDGAGLTPYNAVQFIYEERPNKVVGYVGGAQMSSSQRLKAIQTFAEGGLVRDYQLAYDLSPSTGRDRLTQLTECNGQGGCLAPTTFEWQDGVNAFEVQDEFPVEAFGGWHNTPELIRVMDVNGDGLMDLVFGPGENGKWSVLKSTGSSFIVEKGWATDAFKEWHNTPELIRPMDANGDGLMDLVFGPGENGKWSVLKNTGSSFIVEKGWATDAFTEWRNTPALIRPMDVNDDNMMDLVFGPSENGKWSVLKSTGSSFIVEKGWATGVFAGWRNTPELIRPIDVNGDRMMDLVLGPGENGKWSVLKSTGTSFVVEKGWAIDTLGNWNTLSRRIWPLDVNGDSLIDFLFGPSEAGEWVVLRSAGPKPCDHPQSGQYPKSDLWGWPRPSPGLWC